LFSIPEKEVDETTISELIASPTKNNLVKGWIKVYPLYGEPTLWCWCVFLPLLSIFMTLRKKKSRLTLICWQKITWFQLNITSWIMEKQIYIDIYDDLMTDLNRSQFHVIPLSMPLKLIPSNPIDNHRIFIAIHSYAQRI
jgi:hypothetical protein